MSAQPVPHATRRSIIEQAAGFGDRPLWRAHTIALSAEGEASGDFAVRDMVFAPGNVREGSFFVARGDVDTLAALARGAVGVLTTRPISGPHVLVADIDVALSRLARAARNRSRATVIAVAGFDDEPGASIALHDALNRASRGLAWRADGDAGIEAALCSMPADRSYALFEGDIAPAARVLRPHLLLGAPGLSRDGGRAIAEALLAGGAAILPADQPDFAWWRAAALDGGAQVFGYGCKASADIRLIDAVRGPDGGLLVTAEIMGARLCYALDPRICDPLLSLAVIGAMRAAGASLGSAALALEGTCGHPAPAALAG